MIKEDNKIRMQKIDVAESPEFETPSWKNYTPGEHHPDSLPVKYEVKGRLTRDIKEGIGIKLDRFERNGKRVPGFTQTSQVQNIEVWGGKVFAKTLNSIYLIEKI